MFIIASQRPSDFKGFIVNHDYMSIGVLAIWKIAEVSYLGLEGCFMLLGQYAVWVANLI